MGQALGYLITWVMYGTWLQGDDRGYVKKAKTYHSNTALMQANRKLQLQNSVNLSKQQQQIVRAAIIEEARLQNQKIYALAICPDHVHAVVEYTKMPISKMVAYYKKTARIALKATGLTGRVWARGYDKRFCFDQVSVQKRIEYVQKHNQNL